jgi:hypothetical protein
MVDLQQPPWLLIGGAPHHDPIDAREMVGCLSDIRDAAIKHDRQFGMRKLETINAIVIEGRNLPVLVETAPQAAFVCTMSAPGPLFERAGQRLTPPPVLLIDA